MTDNMVDKYRTDEGPQPEGTKIYGPVAVATALSIVCGIIQVRIAEGNYN